MPKLETLQIQDLSSAIIQKISNRLSPQNSCRFAYNLLFDEEIGSAVVREGTGLIGAQITDGQEILGLYQFIKSDGNKYFLAVVNGASNSALYRLIDSTWTSESVAKAKDVKHRFLTYLDTVMVLDGTNVYGSADGDTWVTTGGNLDLGDCPAGKYVIEWQDRVYVAGVLANPDRLNYSSIPTAGVISWDGDYIDIEPGEGQGAITGLGKVPGYLLIFKERALKRWNGSSTYPDDLNRLGTSSQESVVNGKTTCFYFSGSYKRSIGFYETNGETTRKISRPIQEIVEAIPVANYSDIAGFSDGEIVIWSVGTLTYDGISYSNVVVLYHIDTQTWAVLGYPTEYKVFSSYIDSSGNLKITGGNDDGEVIELFTGTKDSITGSSNQEISYALQYPSQDFGSRARIKEITSVMPHLEKGLNTKVSVRVDNATGFQEKGTTLNEWENEITVNERGHIFEFRLSGRGLGNETKIIGLDILEPNILASIKQ